MAATLITLALVTAASIVVGEAICRLAGLGGWSGLAPGVGLAAVLVAANGLVGAPGHTTTAGAVILAATAGAGVWLWRGRRPSSSGSSLRAAAPAGLVLLAATLLPFAVNGRFGMLGVSVNNDTRLHLWAAEYLLAGLPVHPSVLGEGYPLGPHALAATLADVVGGRVDLAFTGLLMAVPILTGLTALAALRELARPRQVVVAVLVGLPYLLAAYFAQAAFKETLQALFVLTFALTLRAFAARGALLRPGAAAVLAVVAAGSLVTYSYPGLAWPVAIMAVAVIADVAVNRRRVQPRAIMRAARRAAPALGIAAVVLLVLLAPQLPRLAKFFEALALSPAGSGAIAEGNIGNLVRPLSPYQAFGLWPSEDFRLIPENVFRAGLLGAVGLGAAVFGLLWWLKRRDVVLPSAAVAAGLVYLVLRNGESAYLAAKALVILSPLVALLAGKALLAPARGWPTEALAAKALLAVVFVAGAAYSSVLALRGAPVNPEHHQEQLIALRDEVAGSRVLFLGHDDFIGWRLFGAEVTNPPVQAPVPFTLRSEKPFADGQSLDFDSVPAQDLDRYHYVVTTRTRYDSVPPENFRMVRRTDSYELWAREGPTRPHAVLAEGDRPGSRLNCRSEEGRTLAATGGTAVVRPAPVVVDAPSGVGAGGTMVVEMRLPRQGRWSVSLQYASPQRLALAAPGLRSTLPPHLDRVGPFYQAGTMTVARPGAVRIAVSMKPRRIMSAKSQYAPIREIAAVPVEPARTIGLAQACGRYVDWYRPAA